MNQVDALTRITQALSKAGIAYMLTGSFAGVFYGSNLPAGPINPPNIKVE